ncbi:MAG: hypothetical protein P4L40_25885 [Terracidiphilus sp.]|nr:hypothetical protein [Terracidiphilus sp.]
MAPSPGTLRSVRSPVKGGKPALSLHRQHYCDDCLKFDASLKELATAVCISCLPLVRDSGDEGRYLCADDAKR